MNRQKRTMEPSTILLSGLSAEDVTTLTENGVMNSMDLMSLTYDDVCAILPEGNVLKKRKLSNIAKYLASGHIIDANTEMLDILRHLTYMANPLVNLPPNCHMSTTTTNGQGQGRGPGRGHGHSPGRGCTASTSHHPVNHHPCIVIPEGVKAFTARERTNKNDADGLREQMDLVKGKGKWPRRFCVAKFSDGLLAKVRLKNGPDFFHEMVRKVDARNFGKACVLCSNGNRKRTSMYWCRICEVHLCTTLITPNYRKTCSEQWHALTCLKKEATSRNKQIEVLQVIKRGRKRDISEMILFG
jgi:hypothetical protein